MKKVDKMLNDLLMYVDEVQMFVDEQSSESKYTNRERDYFCRASELLDNAKEEINSINAKLKKDEAQEKKLDEIHCLAENIIDEIEQETHNKIDKQRVSQDYILEKACQILDIALS